MADLKTFSKGPVGNGQVTNNGTVVNAKVEDFKKKVDSYDNKVSSAKNVTIDLSVFLEDMKFDHQVDGNTQVESLDTPGPNNN